MSQETSHKSNQSFLFFAVLLSTFDSYCQRFTDCTLVQKGTLSTLSENRLEERRKKMLRSLDDRICIIESLISDNSDPTNSFYSKAFIPQTSFQSVNSLRHMDLGRGY